VQTAFLGDLVLTIPLLVRLAARHGPVDVVTTPAAAPLLQPHHAVRRVIPFDKHGAERGLGGLGRLARRLRSARYARAWLPHRSLRSALLARWAGIPERTGFGGWPARLTGARAVPCPASGHYAARLLSLAGDGGPVPGPPWIELTDAERAGAAAWCRGHGVPERFLALAPGSRWGSKRWPYYAEFARLRPEPVVVLGDAADTALGDAIVAAAPGRAWNAAGRLSLRQSAALLARAACLVTNDSAPLHLASALGVPVVALFGPTVPAFGFGPLGPRTEVVEHPGLACRPCSRHGPEVCPRGHHRCLRELEPDRVAAAVARVGAGD